jgi:hypothetical protein
VDTPSSDFEELLACLNAHHVRALVVGGHALAFHGRPRYTKDLDVLVEPTPENAGRLIGALVEFGFGEVDLSQDDFAVAGKVVQLGFAPNRVDLLTSIDGVSFDQAWQGRASGMFGAVPIAYLGRNEFVANKRAAGRPQDLADIDALLS